MQIRLLLADDHSLIREGFKSILGGNELFQLVGEADNGMDVVSLVEQTQPDVVLIDINMPRLNGIQVIEKLHKTHPHVKYLVLTMHEEREYVLKALKAGADGYVLKSIERAELEKAIKTVYKGGKYFSPQITSIIAESAANPPAETPELTQREKEILGMVANGRSTKQIADELQISVRTVESHRINMLKKMAVGNTAELIKKSMELGIL